MKVYTVELNELTATLLCKGPGRVRLQAGAAFFCGESTMTGPAQAAYLGPGLLIPAGAEHPQDFVLTAADKLYGLAYQGAGPTTVVVALFGA